MYFFLFVLSFLLIFLVGHFVLNLYKYHFTNIVESIFYKIVFGLFLSASLYSIYQTKLKTINIGLFVILILILFSEKRVNKKLDFKICFLEVKELFYLISTIIPVLLLKYFFLFNNKSIYPIVINRDSIYHSNLSQFLNNFGIESFNTNVYHIPDGVHPYHYFESWVNAFFSKIFSLNYWLSIELIVHPLFLIILLSGIWTFLKKINQLNLYSRILSLLVVFFSGFFLERLSIYEVFEAHLRYNAFDEDWGLKLSIAYVVVVFALISFLEKKIVKALLILQILPLISIVFLIGIFFSSILLIIYCTHRKLSGFKFIYLIIPIIGTVFIYAFYSFFGASYNYVKIPNLNFINDINGAYFIDKLIVFIYTIFKIFISYSPFILILLFIHFTTLKRKNEFLARRIKLFILYTIFVFMISSLEYLIFEDDFGGKTYLYYQLLPFLNLIFVLCLIHNVSLIKKKSISIISKFGLSLILLIFVIRSIKVYSLNKYWTWDKYSTEFLNIVNEKISKLNYPIGGEILDYKRYNYNSFSDNTDVLGYFTVGMNKNSKNLALWFIDLTPKEEKSILNENYQKESDIYSYKEKLIKNKKFVSNDLTRYNFILEKKLSYIFVDSGLELDSNLKKLVVEEYKDSKSGIIFAILKH